MYNLPKITSRAEQSMTLVKSTMSKLNLRGVLQHNSVPSTTCCVFLLNSVVISDCYFAVINPEIRLIFRNFRGYTFLSVTVLELRVSKINQFRLNYFLVKW